MKAFIITILALTFSLTINAQGSFAPLAKPVADCGINMDMTHLSGTWFEISRLPNAVDSDLKNVRISFETKNKMVKRSVTGYKDNGRMVNVNGKLNYLGCGTYTGTDGGVYMVLSVDEDYQHVLMGTPDHKYLWVLSRTSTMDDSEYQELIHKASEMNYDVAGVQLTSHN
jgi:apolipoprotein D and lipocalin family protein